MITNDEVQVLVQELITQADRLGLVWRLIPATVTISTVSANATCMVDLDGDGGTAPARAMTLIGDLLAGERVMVLVVPPDGIYVIGRPKATPVIGAHAYRTATQSIATGGSPTSISWDTENRDNGNFIVVPGTNIVLPLTGLYMGIANMVWAANATGFRFVGIYQNAGFVNGVQGTPAPAGAATYQGVSSEFTGTAGDIITVRVQQGSGVSLNIQGNFSIRYLGSPSLT